LNFLSILIGSGRDLRLYRRADQQIPIGVDVNSIRHSFWAIRSFPAAGPQGPVLFFSANRDCFSLSFAPL
jgi:hypothetical protein